jgi:hypothetical protein
MPDTDPAAVHMAEAIHALAQRLEPLDTMAQEVHAIHGTLQGLLQPVASLARMLPLAYGALALLVAATLLGTWLMLRDSREGHAALVKMIEQSAANQAEMLRRLHPQP